MFIWKNQSDKNCTHLIAQFTILDAAAAQSLQKELQGVGKVSLPIILDLSTVTEIKRQTLGLLRELATYCVENSLPITILVEKSLHQFLFDHGLTYLIPSYCDIQEILQKLPNAKTNPGEGNNKNLVENFLQATIKSTQFTFQTLCGQSLQVGRPYIRGEGPLPEADLASVMNIQVQSYHVLLILRMPKDLLLSLMRKMLEDEKLPWGPESSSATMEFLNCLTGRLKCEMRDCHIDSGIPTLVQNQALNERPLGLLMDKNSTIIPFRGPLGSFNVEFMAYYALREGQAA